MKASRGTVIPPQVRYAVLSRDHGCVAKKIGWEHVCFGALELDHIRASGGLGMKSRSTPDNLVSLCATAHREKTLNGKAWRPKLIAYIESRAA